MQNNLHKIVRFLHALLSFTEPEPKAPNVTYSATPKSLLNQSTEIVEQPVTKKKKLEYIPMPTIVKAKYIPTTINNTLESNTSNEYTIDTPNDNIKSPNNEKLNGIDIPVYKPTKIATTESVFVNHSNNDIKNAIVSTNGYTDVKLQSEEKNKSDQETKRRLSNSSTEKTSKHSNSSSSKCKSSSGSSSRSSKSSDKKENSHRSSSSSKSRSSRSSSSRDHKSSSRHSSSSRHKTSSDRSKSGKERDKHKDKNKDRDKVEKIVEKPVEKVEDIFDDTYDDDVGSPLLDMSSDEDDIMEQCKMIFDEYKPVEKPTPEQEVTNNFKTIDLFAKESYDDAAKKKRKAHENMITANSVNPTFVQRKNHVQSAMQVLYFQIVFISLVYAIYF